MVIDSLHFCNLMETHRLYGIGIQMHIRIQQYLLSDVRMQ